jgi:acyl carrier protein
MLDKIRQIVADITHNDVAHITSRSNSQNLDGWDSVAQINIIVGIEEEFGVAFGAEEMHMLNSVEKIADALSAISTRR